MGLCIMDARKLARNATQALRNPRHILGYARYSWSRLRHGTGTRTISGIRIGDLRRYSEWNALSGMLTARERQSFDALSLSGKPILDIGANVGLLSIYFAHRFPESSVFVFEPGHDTCESLRMNVKLNGVGNVEVIEAAVSNKTGEVPFEIVPQSSAQSRIGGCDGTFVRSVTVDSFCAERDIGEVALMKVDVEGFEEEVFEGARGMLAERRIRFIYYEVCPGNCSATGHDVEVPSKMLRPHGYQLHRVKLDGVLEGMHKPEPSGVARSTNWLGVRPRTAF